MTHQPAYGRESRGGVWFVAAGAALWGTDAVLRAPVGGAMAPSAIVLAEHLLLALYAVPVLWVGRELFARLDWRRWVALIAIAWGGSGLATVLFTAAFATGNPTTVILLQKAQPLLAVSLAGLWLREPLGPRYWLAFAVAIVGAYLISFGTLDPIWQLPEAQIVTAALALGAAALWGSATVFGRYVLGDLPFPWVTAARFFFALPFLVALTLVQGKWDDLSVGAAQFPINLILIAAGPGLISLLLYYRGLAETRASIATIAELAFPATAVVLNWLFLGRGVSVGQMIGFGLLWGAIVWLQWSPAAGRRSGK